MKANLITFVLAVVAFLTGLWLLWFAWKGEPVAAPFTRVGGPTRVETAIEASRFWLDPPQRIVTTPANARKEVTWGAARCAVLHDAPLLFTSRNPNRKRLVDALIRDKKLTNVRNESDVRRCLNGDQSASPLSTLEVPDGPLLLPQTEARTKLAPAVVFAAAKTPADLPDIAVGLTLAAHMAKADREVSFVVVPRYLEADPELEHQLRAGRERVTGGLVLGQTGVISEDTRALLRQVIRSTDRQGVLGEVRTSVGSLGAALGAFLALLGVGAAARVAPDLTREVVERAPEWSSGMKYRLSNRFKAGHVPHNDKPKPEEVRGTEPHLKGLDLLTDFSEQVVTVKLRSGLWVTGKLASSVPSRVSVLELENASFRGDDQKQSGKRVRVLLEEIELISVQGGHKFASATADPDGHGDD